MLVFSEKGLLCAQNPDGTVRLPSCGELGLTDGWHLFSVDGTGFFIHEGAPMDAQGVWQYINSRKLREFSPNADLFACGAAESLYRWYASNRFCGRCGGRMAKGTTERSLVCPDCGQTVYPKICPGIIAAVCDGDRLLLTKYAGRAFTRWALVAGFNEIGEAIETTVRREVMEEVGLRIKNLRFYRSQPWVYTDTLLCGFFAELDGSDRITLQESELAEAVWFSRDELPEDHSSISLTGEMIEYFRKNGFPAPDAQTV